MIAARFSQPDVREHKFGPTSAGDRAIDLVHLARQTDADSDLEAELLRMFDAQAAKLSARLALADLGAQAKSDIAHRLRGSALAIGAWRVAAAAEAAEAHYTLLVAGRPAVADPLAELDAAVSEARAAIARLKP